jgi:hypothetical protein
LEGAAADLAHLNRHGRTASIVPYCPVPIAMRDKHEPWRGPLRCRFPLQSDSPPSAALDRSLESRGARFARSGVRGASGSPCRGGRDRGGLLGCPGPRRTIAFRLGAARLLLSSRRSQPLTPRQYPATRLPVQGVHSRCRSCCGARPARAPAASCRAPTGSPVGRIYSIRRRVRIRGGVRRAGLFVGC